MFKFWKRKRKPPVVVGLNGWPPLTPEQARAMRNLSLKELAALYGDKLRPMTREEMAKLPSYRPTHTDCGWPV